MAHGWRDGGGYIFLIESDTTAVAIDSTRRIFFGGWMHRILFSAADEPAPGRGWRMYDRENMASEIDRHYDEVSRCPSPSVTRA